MASGKASGLAVRVRFDEPESIETRLVTGGAEGIRTPDPLLAKPRTHVRFRPSLFTLAISADLDTDRRRPLASTCVRCRPGFRNGFRFGRQGG